MCARCHLWPVSAYLRFRVLEALLNLSGTPQRGFCIQLEDENKRKERSRKTDVNQVCWANIYRQTPSQDNMKHWSELRSSLPYRWQRIRAAKLYELWLNYSKLKPLIQVCDQKSKWGLKRNPSVSFIPHCVQKYRKQEGKTFILTSAWYHCIIMQMRRRKSVKTCTWGWVGRGDGWGEKSISISVCC